MSRAYRKVIYTDPSDKEVPTYGGNRHDIQVVGGPITISTGGVQRNSITDDIVTFLWADTFVINGTGTVTITSTNEG